MSDVSQEIKQQKLKVGRFLLTSNLCPLPLLALASLHHLYFGASEAESVFPIHDLSVLE